MDTFILTWRRLCTANRRGGEKRKGGEVTWTREERGEERMIRGEERGEEERRGEKREEKVSFIHSFVNDDTTVFPA